VLLRFNSNLTNKSIFLLYWTDWQKHSHKESAKNLLTLVTESISPNSKTLLAYYQSNSFESKKNKVTRWNQSCVRLLLRFRQGCQPFEGLSLLLPGFHSNSNFTVVLPEASAAANLDGFSIRANLV
jgi:hypothetical protein